MSKFTELTLKYLRDLGYEAQVVEKYNSLTRQRKDLFGVIDIIAIKRGEPLLGVQSTSYQQRAKHLALIERLKATVELWCSTRSEFWMITWRKQKLVRGGKAFKYVPVVDYWRV